MAACSARADHRALGESVLDQVLSGDLRARDGAGRAATSGIATARPGLNARATVSIPAVPTVRALSQSRVWCSASRRARDGARRGFGDRVAVGGGEAEAVELGSPAARSSRAQARARAGRGGRRRGVPRALFGRSAASMVHGRPSAATASKAATGSGSVASRRSSLPMRVPLIVSSAPLAIASPASSRVCGAIAKSSRAAVAGEAQQPRRVVLEAPVVQHGQLAAARGRRARRRCQQDSGLAPVSPSAIALTVKSRRSRSVAIGAGSTSGSAPGMGVALAAGAGEVVANTVAADPQRAKRDSLSACAEPMPAASSSVSPSTARSTSTNSRPSIRSRTVPPDQVHGDPGNPRRIGRSQQSARLRARGPAADRVYRSAPTHLRLWVPCLP